MKKSKTNLVTVFLIGFAITVTASICLASDDGDLKTQNEALHENKRKDEGPCCDNGYTTMSAPKAMMRATVINEEIVVKEQAVATPSPLGKKDEGPCCDNGLTSESTVHTK